MRASQYVCDNSYFRLFSIFCQGLSLNSYKKEAIKLDIEKIKRLCKERGTSIRALEQTLGIGNGVIGKWSNSSPRVDTAKLVADYFGITVDDLLADGTKNGA